MSVRIIPSLPILRRIRTVAELAMHDIPACVQEIQRLVQEMGAYKNPAIHAAYILGVCHGCVLRARSPDVLQETVIPLIDKAIEEKRY